MKFDFHERFEINIDGKAAKLRFVNRIYNGVISSLFQTLAANTQEEIKKCIADHLGDIYSPVYSLPNYIEKDFNKVLQALEAFFKAATPVIQARLTVEIKRVLDVAEIDLGIRWENGRFIRNGAKSLDEVLVNESLRWLSDKKHQSVLQPYSKGIEHFLQATKRPDLLSDVITDMYEALEALAKIITGRDKDFSTNAELFLKEVKASESYKKILKEYIAYANNFRHGVDDHSKKPNLSVAEVESFIYLTGIFIRLAISKDI